MIKISKTLAHLTIGIPNILILKSATTMPENPAKVMDDEAFLNAVIEYLEKPDPEDGLTPVAKLFDSVFEQMMNDGLECIEPIQE